MYYLNQIQKFSNEVEENMEEEIDVDALINHTHISKFHFYRLFKAVVGLSVHEYIKGRKLSKAAEALAHTKDTILTIAIRYGFGSQAVFTRNFKKINYQTNSY